ncbi:hypothetical protein DFQ11_101549 [Winogradskyella epiphytica]|uniref:Outer membrane protein with beta-barrel domain n=1 Tax=Winogradskyella epiphytica TaxID=262005 RepID=A0A2V4X0C0_9FLAO|nr:hypothetical protein [Winogradskyella epiphytica]PYE83118.1 hypothetical protein DFQ11_101549 [Winogradskyella epiphytica]GGW55916.1 hypothetical protein GCM10008085_04160 [Winogradskyella epiphytica]
MRTLFFFLVVATSVSLNAQITKGNWLIGGNGEFTSQSFEFDNGSSSKREYLTIKPNVGYFLKDKFAVGSSLRYENFDSFNIYGVGVFTRYYFLNLEKQFNLFVQLHYDFTHTVSDVNSIDDNALNSSFYGIRLGQVIFFNNVVGMEFSLVYEKGNLQDSNSDSFKAVLGFQIHLSKN